MAPADRDPRSVSGIMLPPPFPATHKLTSPSILRMDNRSFASEGQEQVATAPARRQRPRFDVLPLDVPSWINSLYSWDITNQAGADVEPANIAITLSGTTYHVSTCAHWNGSGYDFLAKSATNFNSGSSGSITTNTLVRPVGSRTRAMRGSLRIPTRPDMVRVVSTRRVSCSTETRMA